MCGRKFTVKTVCMAAKQMVRHFPLSYCSVVFPPTSNVVLAMMPRLNPLTLEIKVSLVILFSRLLSLDLNGC